MGHDLRIAKGSKTELYENLLPQITGLLENEPDLIANLANTVAALKEQFGWLWIGFYLVKNDELVLGPFQGPVACTRIRKGRGVCGASWEQAKTLIVADVEKFPGHIACSSLLNRKSSYQCWYTMKLLQCWMRIAIYMISLIWRISFFWKQLSGFFNFNSRSRI